MPVDRLIEAGLALLRKDSLRFCGKAPSLALRSLLARRYLHAHVQPLRIAPDQLSKMLASLESKGVVVGSSNAAVNAEKH